MDDAFNHMYLYSETQICRTDSGIAYFGSVAFYYGGNSTGIFVPVCLFSVLVCSDLSDGLFEGVQKGLNTERSK